MAKLENHNNSAQVNRLFKTRLDLACGLLWGAFLLWVLGAWVGMKHSASTLGLLSSWGIFLMALPTLGLSSWQFLLAFSSAPFENSQRRLLAFLVAGLSGLLLVFTMIFIIFGSGSAFAEASSAFVLSLIGLGTARMLMIDPEKELDIGSLIESAIRYRLNISFSLIIVGGIALIIGLYLILANRLVINFPLQFALAFFGIVLVGGGLWLIVAAADLVTPISMRGLILIVGGLAGFALAVGSGFQVFFWRSEIIINGMKSWQSEESWKLWLCVYLGLAGLVLIFGSFWLGKMDIRVSPMFRRLFYGYNAVLTGLLLLAILTVINIMIYTRFPYNYNWSATQGFYSLSSKSKNILDSIKDEPIKATVVMSQTGPLFADIRNLLENMNSYNPRLVVEYVSPDLEPDTVKELAKNYAKLKKPGLSESEDGDTRTGVLLVRGKDTGKLDNHTFVDMRDLFAVANESQEERDPQKIRKYKEFLGENVLMTEISYLATNQSKPLVYITQGVGEYDIKPFEMIGPFRRPVLSTSEFIKTLKAQKYEVRILNWGFPKGKERSGIVDYFKSEPKSKGKIPIEADVLVIADPKTLSSPPFDKEMTNALDVFMAHGGRIIFLSNAHLGEIKRGGPKKIIDLGIEDWFKRYGVDLGKDRVLTYHGPNNRTPPIRAEAIIAMQGKNKITQQEELRGRRVLVDLSRTVSPSFGGNAFGYSAEPLIIIPPKLNSVSWGERDAKHVLEARDYIASLVADKKIIGKFSDQPLPVGVTVFDKEDDPRMVVMGDATFIENNNMETQPYRDFMLSCVAIMANRPQMIGIEAKKTSTFKLDPVNFSLSRMTLLPLGLMVLGIAGLGTGVWLSRRR